MMKNFLLFFVFIFSNTIFSQKMFELSLNCHNNGDTIPMSEAISKNLILNIKTPNINYDNEQSYKFISWEILFTNSGKTLSFPASATSKEGLSPAAYNDIFARLAEIGSQTKKIIITNIKIAFTKNEKDIQIYGSPDFVFYISKKGKACIEKSMSTLINYKGKILTGEKIKTPVINQEVILKNANNLLLETAITDKYGDFNFKSVSTNLDYNIEIPNHEKKIKDGVLYIANENGLIQKTIKELNEKFEYKLLAIEIQKLNEVVIDDTELTLKTFSTSKTNSLTVVKDIYYDVNSALINQNSQEILNQIVNSMKVNNALKLTIISYTDARGDDNLNKILSEKRAENVLNYFLEKGIEKERLSSKGMGETKIINRCFNTIDCSEVEHKLNRRTEFLFIK